MSLPDEAPAGTGKGSPQPSRWWNAVTVALVLVAVVLGVLWLIPANSYVFLPGEALSVAPMISVKGYPPLKRGGTLYLTDVSLYKANHLIEELYGRLNPDATVQPAQDVSQGLSDQQYLQLNTQMMNDSIQQAEAAALNVVPGFKPHYSARSPQIVFVMPKAPAAKVLKAGDVVLAVDGHPTHRLASAVGPYVRQLKPGQIAHLTILRGNRVLHLSVPTMAAPGSAARGQKPQALVGIYVQDRLVFPVKISINAGSIGGPSAGLQFTLGIIERLERRDLTKGCRVAGTGTIDAAGKVGAIGGARQKIVAARHAGARYFFVPKVKDQDNLLGAQAARGNVTVVPIKTLHQALTYLSRLKPCR